LDVAAALMMLPADEKVLSERVVSKAVNNVKNNASDLFAYPGRQAPSLQYAEQKSTRTGRSAVPLWFPLGQRPLHRENIENRATVSQIAIGICLSSGQHRCRI
jgi:hypothetical protein